MDEREIIKIVLIQLVSEAGGTVSLDADKIVKDLREGSIKGLTINIIDGKVVLEVVDEDKINAS